MTEKLINVGIFWLPLIAGIILGGMSPSVWYGGDKLAGFVGGDALDHAAPIGPVKLAWAFVVVERGCGACGDLYPVPSPDHLQSRERLKPERLAREAAASKTSSLAIQDS